MATTDNDKIKKSELEATVLAAIAAIREQGGEVTGALAQAELGILAARENRIPLNQKLAAANFPNMRDDDGAPIVVLTEETATLRDAANAAVAAYVRKLAPNAGDGTSAILRFNIKRTGTGAGAFDLVPAKRGNAAGSAE